MHACTQQQVCLSLPLPLFVLYQAQPPPPSLPKFSTSCTDRLPCRKCHGNVKPVNIKIVSPDSGIAAVAAPSRRPGALDHITPISLCSPLSTLIHIFSGEMLAGAGDPEERTENMLVS
ncbi:hypothetical protein CCMA1212_010063 [Trichoderma ghanense]|uniref:Uncharacterized protein n=1 Tax=Trichoderma ghanense TaxID=65468 RepID=A0ABY2GR47_9HYPO